MIYRLALRNLLRNPRRTLAVVLTVALGSGSLFIYRGFNHGIMNQYRENTVHSRYGHGEINTAGYRDKVYEKPWEHWIPDWKATADKIKKFPGVEQVFPRVQFFGLLTNGRITVAGRGLGVDGPEEARFFNTLNVEQGEPLSTQTDGILLGRGLARSLDVKPGDRVTILANTVNGSMNGVDLTVTGIFHTGAKEFDDSVYRIQLTEAMKLLDTDRVESIAVGLNSQTWESTWPQLESMIRGNLPELEATPFAVLDKVYYQNSVDWLNSQFGIIQFIILTIVVLGIFNTVSTGILDRKQEIGNLRANGESAGQVIQLLCWEGAALGMIGAAFGIALAWGLNSALLSKGIVMPPAPGLTRQFAVMIEFRPAMAVASFILGATTALFGTVLAAIRVARMPIADALRST
jgi:putative ABC transport system permease protein